MDYIRDRLRKACDALKLSSVEKLLKCSDQQLDANGLGFLKYHGGIHVVLHKLFPGTELIGDEISDD